MPPQRTKRAPVPRGRKGPPPAREEGPQRIAKLLARAGVASRRDIERMIADGRIALDGEVLTTPATLLADLKGVTVDGKTVKRPEAARLFRFYKPPTTLTAASDPKGRPTIYDRLPPGLPRLMPVGRLDFMTEGLLLLTNDGELKRQTEGKNREVRRVLAHLGLQVSRLIRTAYGPLTLAGLEPGMVAEVQREDLFDLKRQLA